MKLIQCYFPALICGLLSLVTLGAVLFAPSPTAVVPVLLCFLPIPFCLVGTAMRVMQREIRELRAQLSEQAGTRP